MCYSNTLSLSFSLLFSLSLSLYLYLSISICLSVCQGEVNVEDDDNNNQAKEDNEADLHQTVLPPASTEPGPRPPTGRDQLDRPTANLQGTRDPLPQVDRYKDII